MSEVHNTYVCILCLGRDSQPTSEMPSAGHSYATAPRKRMSGSGHGRKDSLGLQSTDDPSHFLHSSGATDSYRYRRIHIELYTCMKQ